MARRGGLRDCVAWAIIISGHALLIVIFTGSARRQITAVPTADASAPAVLIVLDVPAEGGSPVADSPQLASMPMVEPLTSIPELDSGSSAITLPPEEEERGPGSDAIDWRLEAERSARIVVEPKHGVKHIGQHPPSPFREKPKPREFPWNTEPRAGFAPGFIPYVRIGQRCVVGLGFFGCNLGKLPEANGHLFDGMHDPDRQRSSVPDVDTSSALDPPLD